MGDVTRPRISVQELASLKAVPSGCSTSPLERPLSVRSCHSAATPHAKAAFSACRGSIAIAWFAVRGMPVAVRRATRLRPW